MVEELSQIPFSSTRPIIQNLDDSSKPCTRRRSYDHAITALLSHMLALVLSLSSPLQLRSSIVEPHSRQVGALATRRFDHHPGYKEVPPSSIPDLLGQNHYLPIFLSPRFLLPQFSRNASQKHPLCHTQWLGAFNRLCW